MKHKRKIFPRLVSGSRTAQDIDPIDAHIGARLRIRRNLAGMTQVRLGKMSGVTFQQIQKYERGTNRISAGGLFRLAHILNVSVIWFYEGLSPHLLYGNDEARQNASDDAGDILHRPETLELIRAYYAVNDPNQRRRFYDFLKSMSSKTA